MKRKNLLKRSLSLLLSLLMCASIAMPAYAADDDTEVTEQTVVMDAEETTAESTATAESNTDADSSTPAEQPTEDAEPAADSSETAPTDEETVTSTVIAAFGEYTDTVTLTRGTLEELTAQLPAEIPVTMEDGTETTLTVTWACEEEDAEDYAASPEQVSGMVFNLVIPEGYTLAEGLSEWDVPSITVMLTDEEVSEIPYGRQFTYGNFGTAYVNAGDDGAATLSEVGADVYITKGNKITYMAYATYRYTANINGTEYLAFCAQPSKSSTTGWYTVSKLDSSSETGRLIKAAMLMGYGGPLFDGDRWFPDGASESTQYAYQHMLIGLLYDNDSKGIPSSIRSDVVSWKDTVISELNIWLSDPNSLLSQNFDDYTVFIAYNDAGQDMVWMEYTPQPKTTSISIVKTSTIPDITNGNSCYSLDGAVYGVYSDAGCTNLVTTITTSDGGKGTADGLTQGTYWLKEITASPGYYLDAEIYTADANSTTGVTVNVTERPANDPVGITITKITDSTDTNVPSLAGAQFTVRYYDGQYSSVSQLPANATRTWVIQTIPIGKSYVAALGGSYKVGGDDFYLDSAGTPCLPLGTITIQETQAPSGYTLNGSYLNNTAGTVMSDSNGVAVVNITQPANGTMATVTGGNYYTKTDKEITGGVKLYKYDADTKQHTGQGSAVVSGAEFKIYKVENDTKTLVYTGTTDENGLFQTPSDALTYGHYVIEESKAPAGYTASGTTSQEFDITEDGVIVDLTAFENSISNVIVSGGLVIYKYDSDTNTNTAQGNATLEGAVFEIVNNSDNSVVVNGQSYAKGEVVATVTTDANGMAKTENNLLPYGNYIIREAENGQPTGYTHEGTLSREVTISSNYTTVTVNSIINDVIRGGVKLYKYDADTKQHTAQSGATLEGAEFQIINESDQAVYVNGTKYEVGEVVYTGKTDANGYFETASDLLPYGHYVIQETKAPSGYSATGTLTQEFDITEDGVVVDMTAFENSISNHVVRGDFELRKIDIDTQQSMAGITFEIKNDATGETHTFTTDENGFFSSASSYTAHSKNTNAGTVNSGLWFGQYTDANGNVQTLDVDDSIGALPYGTYTITELQGENNKDYIMWSGKITITRDGFTVDLKDVENFQMRLSTTAKDEETNTHYVSSAGQATIIDTVRYENLLKGTQYTLVSVLMNKATGMAVTDADGNVISASKTFTTITRSGEQEMELTFDAVPLAGATVVVYEYLFLGTDGSTDGIGAVCTHTDLNDEGQTIALPSIKTTAKDSETDTGLSNADSEITIVDTVSYTNLVPGKNYTMTGTLMNKATGEKLLDDNGNEITSSVKFKPTESSGTVDITFTFSGVNMAGTTIVAFETLEYRGYEWATHTDLTDENQTVYVPEIHTTAKDAETADHIALAAEKAALVDTVSYSNLIAGKEYTVTGTLMVKSTGEALKNADGTDVTASTTFTAPAASGTVDITFTFDASALEDESVVAFETATYNGKEIASHTDITDEGQTVNFPKVRTTAQDKDSQTHNAMADESVTIIDTVYYSNLIVGKEYTVSGTLMNQETGTALLDAQGNPVTASETFTAEQEDGSIDLTFTFDGSLLEGESVVAFEDLLYKGIKVGTHADLTDDDQTIHFPKVRTTATEQASGEHITKAEEKVTLVDTVAYENVIVGQEYTVNATVMNQSTGESLKDSKGNEITATATFTAEATSGTIDLSVTIDASALESQSVVFYEALVTNGVQVGLHADITDENQTVHFPRIGTTAADAETEDHVAMAKENAVIVDSVAYENLIPGKEYTVTGTLMVKSTGKALTDANGNAVTASTTFTPDTADGSVDITFTFDASALAGESVVAFESVSYKGIEIATHTDLTDKNQTVDFPKLKTTAKDTETGTHTSNPDEKVTILDTVYYSNLLIGKEYTISGTLMVKSTGKALTDAQGNEITASKTFTAEQKNGSVELTFTFDGSLLEGETVVAFESLTYKDIEVGTHTDLTDKDQSVHFPRISTTATEKESGEHVTKADEKVVLVDTVSYSNLVVGDTYTLNAVVMNQTTGKALTDAKGNEITATATFTATESDGTIDLSVTIDASSLAGQSVVFFETLVHKDIQVGIHADITDEGQTVHFPEIKTTAVDSESKDHSSIADSEITIIDTVKYTNLIPGKEYTVSGVLMNQKTGEKLLDNNGKEVTASTTFTPEKANGSIDITFVFDGSNLAADGGKVVAFETVSYKDFEIATHTDINDENQTVIFPAIHTNAYVGEKQEKQITASGVVTITDVVTFYNLTPGQEYTLVGYLMDKTTGDVVIGVDGYACISQVTFTPDGADGAINVNFSFDTAQFGGKDVVVFETLYKGTDTTVQPVARHTDLNDEGQTVKIVAPPATPGNPKTGDYSVPVLVSCIGLAAAAAFVVLFVAAKKRKATENTAE